MKQDEKRCPACAEVIKKAASVCKHCGRQFSPDEISAARKSDTKNTIMGSIVLVVIGGLLVAWCTPSEKEKAAATAKSAEDKRKGFHCLSAFTGESPQFVDALKAQLRDPESFEHDSTRISPVDKDGEHTIVMEYRAKNGFGGMNKGIAIGTLSNTDCTATVKSADFKL